MLAALAVAVVRLPDALVVPQVRVRAERLPPCAVLPGGHDDDEAERLGFGAREELAHVGGHGADDGGHEGRVGLVGAPRRVKVKKRPQGTEAPVRVRERRAVASVAAVQWAREALEGRVEVPQERVEHVAVGRRLEAPALQRLVPHQQPEQPLVEQAVPVRGGRFAAERRRRQR